MSSLCLILGDQLSHTISCLKGCNHSKDKILICEVWDEDIYVKHPKKKITLLFALMRHFHQSLKKKVYQVIYTIPNNKYNTGSFFGEVQNFVIIIHLNKWLLHIPENTDYSSILKPGRRY